MIDFKPEDFHVSLYNTERKSGWGTTTHYDRGVTIIHLPTGTKVSVDRSQSAHKNKHVAMTILQDLVTPFQESDIVWNGREHVLLTSVRKPFQTCTVLGSVGSESQVGFSEISHTKLGYLYKQVENLKEGLSVVEERYYNDRDLILESIRNLEVSYEQV